MHNGVQAAGAGGGTHAMHGRSRITIDPRIPAMPGCLRFSLLVLGGGVRWKKFLLVMIAFAYLAYIYTGSYLHYTWSSLHTQLYYLWRQFSSS